MSRLRSLSLSSHLHSRFQPRSNPHRTQWQTATPYPRRRRTRGGGWISSAMALTVRRVLITARNSRRRTFTPLRHYRRVKGRNGSCSTPPRSSIRMSARRHLGLWAERRLQALSRNRRRRLRMEQPKRLRTEPQAPRRRYRCLESQGRQRHLRLLQTCKLPLLRPQRPLRLLHHRSLLSRSNAPSNRQADRVSCRSPFAQAWHLPEPVIERRPVFNRDDHLQPISTVTKRIRLFITALTKRRRKDGRTSSRRLLRKVVEAWIRRPIAGDRS